MTTGLPSHWNLDGGIDEIPLPGVSGRLFLTSKHVIGADHLGTIARVGATTVVCLVEAHELSDRYPAYLSWLRANRDGPAIWFPIHDLHAPPLPVMRPLLDELAARVHRGDALIVHCAAGIGRAGTTAVSILLLLGMNLPDALAHVAKHRAMAGPEVGAQRALVMELERALGAERTAPAASVAE